MCDRERVNEIRVLSKKRVQFITGRPSFSIVSAGETAYFTDVHSRMMDGNPTLLNLGVNCVYNRYARVGGIGTLERCTAVRASCGDHYVHEVVIINIRHV